MLQMLGLFAEFERATSDERITARMERAASQGRWVMGRVPCGYVRGVPRKAPSPGRQRAEKLLRAYCADAIDVRTLKREQARINAEVAEAEAQPANNGEKLRQEKEIIDLALDLAKDGASSYRKAKPRGA